MDVSRTEAIDAIDDLLSDMQGASEALSLFVAAEGLDLPSCGSAGVTPMGVEKFDDGLFGEL